MARVVSGSSVQYFILAMIVALFSTMSRAQITNVTDVETTPIPGAGHDYLHMLNETVSPANGSLSVRIQVPVPKGRGLTLPFAFSYDSNAAIPGPTQTAQNPAVQPYLFEAGWSYSVPMLTSQHLDLKGTFEGDPVDCPINTGYVFYDPQGTRHSLTAGNGIVVMNGSSSCQDLGYGSHLTGGDAWISAQAQGAANVTIQGADAMTYTFNGTNFPLVEDRNGNLIKYVDNGKGAFTETDTAGRTVIVSSGFGTTGNTVTVSGIPNSYVLNWGTTATWNYGAGIDFVYQTPNSTCSDYPNGQPNGSATVLKSITLPNGQSFQFYYDTTYGLLNEIVYPTGAIVHYTWGLNSQSESFAGAATIVEGIAHCFFRYSTPVITKRQVSYNGTTIAEEQDFSYSTTWTDNNDDFSAGEWTSKGTTVRTYDLVRSPSRGLSFQTSYTYTPFPIPPLRTHPARSVQRCRWRVRSFIATGPEPCFRRSTKPGKIST